MVSNKTEYEENSKRVNNIYLKSKNRNIKKAVVKFN